MTWKESGVATKWRELKQKQDNGSLNVSELHNTRVKM